MKTKYGTLRWRTQDAKMLLVTEDDIIFATYLRRKCELYVWGTATLAEPHVSLRYVKREDVNDAVIAFFVQHGIMDPLDAISV